ncbi:MAG: glycosyltransferase [Patescibacteria group bacterium]
MKIILIFNQSFACTTGQYVLKILEKENKVYVLNHNDNFQKIYEIKPDFILAIDDSSHYILDVNYHPKAIWIIDSHTSFVCDKVMAKSFDIIFVAQKEYVEKFKKHNRYVYWLPLACDPEWHGKQDLEKIYDVAFIGQLGRGWRKKLLLKLKKDFPSSFISSVDCKDIGKIYSQARIVVNYNVNNDINMRVFEALCSGNLLLTNRIRNNGFEELFEDKKHLVVYDGTYKDLREKINYYLKNEEEREEIAKNGRNLVLAFHTYKHRVEFMIKKILEIKNEKFYDYSSLEYSLLKFNLSVRFLFWKLIYLRIWQALSELNALLRFK